MNKHSFKTQPYFVPIYRIVFGTFCVYVREVSVKVGVKMGVEAGVFVANAPL